MEDGHFKLLVDCIGGACVVRSNIRTGEKEVVGEGVNEEEVKGRS